MALMACPACGREISTDSPRCPHCGASSGATVRSSPGSQPEGGAEPPGGIARLEYIVDFPLEPGEQVLYRTQLHWITVAPALAVLVVAGLFTIATALPAAVVLFPVGLVLFIVGFALGVWRYISYATSEVAITDQRLLAKVGVFRPRSIDVSLGKVESLTVEQGWLGRLLDYGSVVVTSTGGRRDVFRDIESPAEFMRQVPE